MGKSKDMAERDREETGEIRYACLACGKNHVVGVHGRELSKAFTFAIRMTPCPCGGVLTARRAGFDLDADGNPRMEAKQP